MTGDIHVDHDSQSPCARCGGPVLLSVSVPVETARADGGEVTGWRRVVLCPRCDRDNPHAQGLLAFFAAREQITTDTVNEVAPLLREWAQQQADHPPVYSDDDLDEDIRRWRDGEM